MTETVLTPLASVLTVVICLSGPDQSIVSGQIGSADVNPAAAVNASTNGNAPVCIASDCSGSSASQQARLNAVFPNGVCDWTKPGVGQQDPVGPLTYTAGPGGVPLAAAPTSTPI